MVCLGVSRKNGCQSMVKTVLDDLRPEPRRKKWQNYEKLSWKTDDEGFAMFATLSDCRRERASEFCRMSSTCDALQQTLFQGWLTTLRLMRRSVCSSFWVLRIRQSSPTLPTHRTTPPVMFFYSRRWNWSSRGDVFTALKRSRLYRRPWWRRWSEMTWKSASGHGNPAEIAVLIPKGTTSKGMGEDRNFGKW